LTDERALTCAKMVPKFSAVSRRVRGKKYPETFQQVYWRILTFCKNDW